MYENLLFDRAQRKRSFSIFMTMLCNGSFIAICSSVELNGKHKIKMKTLNEKELNGKHKKKRETQNETQPGLGGGALVPIC